MDHTKVVAAIYDSSGQLVDIAWSETPGSCPTGIKLQPGDSKTVRVETATYSGRCLGKGDPPERLLAAMDSYRRQHCE